MMSKKYIESLISELTSHNQYFSVTKLLTQSFHQHMSLTPIHLMITAKILM